MADQQSTTTAVTIAGVEILQDVHGRYSLNTLHKASKAGENKTPGQWLKRKSTQELIKELDSQMSFSTFDVVKGGNAAGTYVHELLAISYAGWISPVFQLKVNQTFLDVKRGQTIPASFEDPVERYPQLRAIRELVTATAHAQWTAERAEEKAHAAEVRAERAENKADIALEDLHRMTVQEFILKNGLYRQFPPSQYKRISKWLGDYSQRYGLRARKAPVVGKAWDSENSYELQAFGAWLDYEQKRPRQIALVDKSTS